MNTWSSSATDGLLWLFAHTNYGIGESLSTDGGATWPRAEALPNRHHAAEFRQTLVKLGPRRDCLPEFALQSDGQQTADASCRIYQYDFTAPWATS